MSDVTEVTGRLRADLLEILRRDNISKYYLILGRAKRLGYTDSDFPSRGGLDRAVDRALQYHRKAGRIHFSGRLGWRIGA